MLRAPRLVPLRAPCVQVERGRPRAAAREPLGVRGPPRLVCRGLGPSALAAGVLLQSRRLPRAVVDLIGQGVCGDPALDAAIRQSVLCARVEARIVPDVVLHAPGRHVFEEHRGAVAVPDVEPRTPDREDGPGEEPRERGDEHRAPPVLLGVYAQSRCCSGCTRRGGGSRRPPPAAPGLLTREEHTQVFLRIVPVVLGLRVEAGFTLREASVVPPVVPPVRVRRYLPCGVPLGVKRGVTEATGALHHAEHDYPEAEAADAVRDELRVYCAHSAPPCSRWSQDQRGVDFDLPYVCRQSKARL